VNAEPLLYIGFVIAGLWAVIGLINRTWRWLTRPRRIITKARLYRFPESM
jgi:hypothetical protein